MKKLLSVLFCVLISFCLNNAQECNKEEFLKKNYLADLGIKPEDVVFLEWSGAYQKINKIAGAYYFAKCQKCEEWNAKYLAELNAELKSVQEYKNKTWQDTSKYNQAQRRRVMSDYRFSQKRIFENKYKDLGNTQEFKELDSSVRSFDWDDGFLDECRRDLACGERTWDCNSLEKSFAKAKTRYEHAIKDFEELPEAKKRGVKNPFID